ncbi:MAG TPA: hypothetical protein VEV41_12915 [Terriglobales bacterium]|nr:hypothetical protein [Terriglobales bacterium]
MKLRVVLYCLLGGVVLLVPALQLGHWFWWYLSGVVLAASFVPVALFGPRSAGGQFGVIFPVLFIVTVLTTWSEALVFVKLPMIQEHPIRNLVSETVFYLVVAVVLAVLTRALKLTRDSGERIPRRTLPKVAGIVVTCAAAYMVYYLIFGAITYQLFTKVYYPDAPALVGRLGLWFWVLQIGRGLLMTLAVVPAVYTLRMSRLQTAICAGLLIWVAGGLAPLLVPNVLMGTAQRFIHIVEIFTQNFTLGLTAGLLLRQRTSADPKHVATAASMG